MHINSELLYTDNVKIIVKATYRENGKAIESALGEGGTAEIAEDNAIRRLLKRRQQELDEKNKNDENPQEPTDSQNEDLKNSFESYEVLYDKFSEKINSSCAFLLIGSPSNMYSQISVLRAAIAIS